jgi:hypothetical protein
MASLGPFLGMYRRLTFLVPVAMKDSGLLDSQVPEASSQQEPYQEDYQYDPSYSKTPASTVAAIPEGSTSEQQQ